MSVVGLICRIVSWAPAAFRGLISSRRQLLVSLLPVSADLVPPARRALGAAALMTLALMLAIAGCAILGLDWRAGRASVLDWMRALVFIASAGMCALRGCTGASDRRAWVLIALTMALGAIAWALWLTWVSHQRTLAIPSVCDVIWLSAYPFLFAGVVLLARRSTRRALPIGVWLDGIIAGSGMAAIGGALMLPVALSSETGRTLAVATELAYPVLDMILLAVLFGALALRGWRLDRSWALLLGAFSIGIAADILALNGIAGGSNSYTRLVDLMYLLEWVLAACAAWQPHREALAPKLQHWSVLLLPTGFTLGSIGVLVYNQFARLPAPIFGLAILTLLAASSRMAIAFRDTLVLADARREALTDELTELPNRRRFMQHLREAVQAAGHAGDTVAVMMFDLDNFKQLNDTLGHSAGDEVLRLIGPRIQDALRATDTVARLGGDEFAIVLDPRTGASDISTVAETILRVLREPFHVHGLALRLSGSLGVASFPEHAEDPEQLLKCADVALYLAKDSRRGWETYASDRDTNSKARLVLATDLAIALERGGILAHFQPIVDTASRRIVGAESLVRWRVADGTILAPNAFVGAAETSGLSRPLTRRMLMLSLEQVAGWRAGGDDLYVAVNTTVADLMDTQFPEEVASALDIHGVPAASLVLEVTESSILSDPERIGAVLADLRSLGVGIALDDFGTGYSSLAHLRSLAVQEVKIDRSFVAAMADSHADSAIVYATIELTHKLGLLAVAEGVEDERTWEALRALGCDRIQGYVISRPVGPAEFQRVLLTYGDDELSGRAAA